MTHPVFFPSESGVNGRATITALLPFKTKKDRLMRSFLLLTLLFG